MSTKLLPNGEMDLVATTPTELSTKVCNNRIADLTVDIQELQADIKIAESNGWKLTSLNRQLSLNEKRVTYYTKVKAALDAGYYIIPNFQPRDVQFFAVRTDKKNARNKIYHWKGEVPDMQPNSLEIGEGRYIKPQPLLGEDTEKFKEGDKEKIRTIFFPVAIDEGVEFPVSMARPEIMEATSRAMALKLFDQIGIVPPMRHYRSRSGRGGGGGNGDPMIIGYLKDPRTTQFNVRGLTFLLAWHLDSRVI